MSDDDFTTEFSEDAELVYQGYGTVKRFGRANNGTQFFVVNELDEEQFRYVIQNIPANTPVIMHAGIGEDVYMPGWDLQLKRAGDGTSTGPNFKLQFSELDEDAYSVLENIQGEALFITLIKGEILVKKKQKKGPHGLFARDLMQGSLFLMPEFWVCVGTENAYFDWLRTQKCCITGRIQKDTDTGKEQCEVAHVRSVRFGSGTSQKPPYFAVPMLPEIHRFNQHTNGIVKVWDKAGRPLKKGIYFPVESEVAAARYFLEEEALKYVRNWVKETIKKDLKLPSLSYCSPRALKEYMKSKGASSLITLLPEER